MTLPGAETINAGIIGLDCLRRIGTCSPLRLADLVDDVGEPEPVDVSDMPTGDWPVASDASVAPRIKSVASSITERHLVVCAQQKRWVMEVRV